MNFIIARGNLARLMITAGLLASPFAFASAEPAPGPSPHGDLESPVPLLTPEGAEIAALRSAPRSEPGTVRPTIDPEFVVIGYAQNDEPRWGFHWHALTHLALTFTNFDADGNITNPGSVTGRSIIYRPGGMADRHGVKVTMTLRNSLFSLPILESVMQDPAKRANLVSQTAALVNDPNDNIAGVNLDLEPAWSNTATRDGVYDFVRELRAALSPDKEISWYIEPQFTTVRYGNIGSVADEIDFFNYSCYPWAGSWSTTAGGVVRRNGYIPIIDRFFEEGMPPEKTVLTLGSYGVSWQTTISSQDPADAYGSPVTGLLGSWGFADAKYETTVALNPAERFLQTPSYSAYYAQQFSGDQFRTVVFEDEFGVEMKARDAQSWPGNVASGRRLAGIGFWSLRWMNRNSFGGFQSYDLEEGANTTKFRTYPHLYQVTQETMAPAGTREFIIEKWEYFDNTLLGAFQGSTYQSIWDRWRNPDEGPDTVGLASASRSIVEVPAGSGQPDNSAYCLQIDFDFNEVPDNRFFYRWEILGDRTENSVRDVNAVNSALPLGATVRADLHTEAAIPGATIRFVLMDANGELELGPIESLETTGWRTMEWDLTTGALAGYPTNFNQYNSGDGVIDTTPGKRDLAIVGFLVEGGGNDVAGTIHLDELRWSPDAPSASRYLINEFAYSNNSQEFVEVFGPAGQIPDGVELRFFDGDSDAPYKVVEIGGATIPANGLLAFGTPSSGAAVTTGFSDSDNDISNNAPGAIQIVHTATGQVHDSVVYSAFGGLGMLVSPATNGVTANGFPWIGEVRPGYSIGRYPDGHDTGLNAADFSVMPTSVGAPNGGSVSLPASFDFESTPSGYFIAYDWGQAGPQAPPAGVGASPNGGDALRVADGVGGNIAFIGDAALGAEEQALEITGHVFIPASSGSSQAIGVGFFGRQGSTFFSPTPDGNGYESGYWLIYHNDSGVEINNGLGNHGGEFRFVLAQNDNMRPNPVSELGSLGIASTGAAAGEWTAFRFSIDRAEDELVAEIGGAVVYAGPIPADAPASGAIQVGHRRTSGGPIADVDGVWVDGLSVSGLGGAPASTDAWMILELR